MLVSNLDWSDYVGRIAIGRIIGGRSRRATPSSASTRTASAERAKVTKVFEFSGMRTSEIPTGEAGNIVGLRLRRTGDRRDPVRQRGARAHSVHRHRSAHHPDAVLRERRTAGRREGKYLTSRQLRDRLYKETRTNISLAVKDTDVPNIFLVSARGELQIAILVEQMRREGFEMLVSRPEVIMKRRDGQKLEPFETLWVDTPQDRLGDIMQNLAGRKAQITNMHHHGDRVNLEATIPTRGIIGFETDMVNLTSGRAVMSHMFKEYAPHCGPVTSRLSGTLVSMDKGVATAFALDTCRSAASCSSAPATRCTRA
jgi:GTP-binding protein